MASKAEKLLAKGKGLEKKGRRDKALEVYRDACRAEPYDPELWTARAEAAEALGLPGEAAEALFHVCDLYARSGMHGEALTAVKRVLALDGRHSGARRMLRILDKSVDAEPPPAPPEPQPVPVPVVPVVEEAAPEVEPPDPILELTADMAKKRRAANKPPPVPEAAVEEHFDDAFEQAFDEVALRAAGAGLDTLSLGDRVPQARALNGGSASEIPLDEEEGGVKMDVVQAVASTLSASPLLSELDSDLVRQLIDCSRLVNKQTGELVFRQGELGSSLYLILAGEVAVQTGTEAKKGPSRELARLRPGAFFGEMALLTNGPRSATVVALKPSDFLEVSRKAVRELVDRDPRVLKLLMRFFRARLVGTLLQTSPLFRGFSREDRRDLVRRFRLRETAPHYPVIKEGDETEGLFVVLVGRLEVLQGDVRLGVLGPGDVFGEMSLLEAGGAMATVRTRGRAWVLLLPKDDFHAVAERHPELREQLAALATDRRQRNRATLASGRGRGSEERLEPV